MESWDIVGVVESEEEARLVAGFLRSNGIQAALTIDPPAEAADRGFGEVEAMDGAAGEPGEIRVLVPPGRLAEALTLLDQREAAEPAPEPGTAPAGPSDIASEIESDVES